MAASFASRPGRRLRLPLLDPGGGRGEVVDWDARSPLSHHPNRRLLPQAEQRKELQRGGRQLLARRSFKTPCAKDELTLHIALETPEEARRLVAQTKSLVSDMHDLQVLLLDQFIDKDYGDDLLLLTAADERSGRLLGMIFWRYLHHMDDDVWKHVNVDWAAAGGAEGGGGGGGKPPPDFKDAWTYVELLCTDRAYRGHGIGKLLLTTALAYSTVKGGKTECVLVLGHGDQNESAKELYRRLGFEEMPGEFFSDGAYLDDSCVKPEHVMVIWNTKQTLGSLSLEEVNGSQKGTRVPQLGSGTDDALQRLDTDGCLEMVKNLTE